MRAPAPGVQSELAGWRKYLTGVRMPKISLVILSLLISSTVHAACMKPAVPTCAKEAGPFSDVADFDACRGKMIVYKNEVEIYMACQREAGQPSDEVELAQNELDQTLSGFNERARRQ